MYEHIYSVIDPWKSKLPGVGSYDLFDEEARKTKGGRYIMHHSVSQEPRVV
jgi:hypothetical protein